MKINGKLIFSLALALLFLFLIIVTLGYSAKARLVPMVVLIQLVQEGRAARQAAQPKAKSVQVISAEAAAEAEEEGKKPKLPPGEKVKRELVAMGWLLGFFVSIVLLGLSIAIPLFVLTFMRFFGRESWKLSVIFAASCFGFVYFVFVWLLQNELYPGILLPLLNQ